MALVMLMVVVMVVSKFVCFPHNIDCCLCFRCTPSILKPTKGRTERFWSEYFKNTPRMIFSSWRMKRMVSNFSLLCVAVTILSFDRLTLDLRHVIHVIHATSLYRVHQTRLSTKARAICCQWQCWKG